MTTNTKETFLALRREYLEKQFNFLNDMQQKAVFKINGPLLLLAGAGSGKTTVVINRIANMIKYGDAHNSDIVPENITDMDVEILREYLRSGDEMLRESADNICALNPAAPWSIIAITFTNKAANELKERLSRTVGQCAEDIWAATFHSACVRILRRYIDRIGYTNTFTIYDASDSERVIKNVLTDLNIDTKAFPPKACQNIISRAKDSLYTPAKFAAEAEGNFRNEKIAEVYKKYQARLKEANALDFDDIIMLTVQLLSEHRDVLDYYHRKFRYVLVDEYQDTNHAQYVLVSLLAGGSGNLCVVGDDDQSIYRFRGATIENILSFEEQFANTETIRLERNYRSTTNILNVANSVIKNNTGRKGKNLWTDIDDGPLPLVFKANNEQDESSFVADEIIAAKAGGAAFSDCAVLYRINAQSMQLENAFRRRAIPYRIIGGMRFFERAEIKDILSYLCIIANPADTLRLERIINVPARKIGDKTVDTVKQLANRDGIIPFDVLSRANDYPELSRASAPLVAFAQMINGLRDKSLTMKISELYDLLLEESGYIAALKAKADFESEGRIENIMELKSNIVEYEKEEGATLSGFLEEVSLFTDLDKYNADDDCVTLMTIHSAKGLEFPTVFVCGLEEGMFPSLRSFDSPEEIEEERRLFYVAATRAKRALFMTYARTRTMFGQTKYGKISRFVTEIPPMLIEEKSNIPTFDDTSFSGGGLREFSSGSNRSERSSSSLSSGEITQKRKPSYNSFSSSFTQSAKSETTSAPVLNLSAGDRISHKAFKEGLVVSVNPVGGDYLLEIAFDGVGTKRLLYKTAAKFITKL
ncbi:MAG: UvrD-helicase domain-containing protein [Oscillospiraceae bacterium]|nr:UvrD-helicase domain-containing protein [Oscillospiraceae bacterium]